MKQKKYFTPNELAKELENLVAAKDKGCGGFSPQNPPVGSFQKQNPPHFLINNLSTLYSDEVLNQ